MFQYILAYFSIFKHIFCVGSPKISTAGGKLAVARYSCYSLFASLLYCSDQDHSAPTEMCTCYGVTPLQLQCSLIILRCRCTSQDQSAALLHWSSTRHSYTHSNLVRVPNLPSNPPWYHPPTTQPTNPPIHQPSSPLPEETTA